MNYFTDFTSINELKEQFRKNCLLHHPDRGGNPEEFKAMMNEYQKLLQEALRGKYGNEEKVEEEMDIDEQMREVIDNIIHLEGIIIEIIGNWLWVSGNTYPVRSVLKESGLKFAGKKKSWYWKSYKYRKRSRKQYSMDDLRKEFNVKQINTKEIKELES